MNKFIIIFIKLICLFAILFSFKFTKQYYIFLKCCLKYMQYYHILDKKCLKCPREVIFNGLKILSSEDTLDEIIKNKRSISRFGDGEFNLILGKKIGFQEVDKTLIIKLKKVLKSKKKGLLIGILLPYNNNYLEPFIYETKKYLINWMESKKLDLFTLLLSFNVITIPLPVTSVNPKTVLSNFIVVSLVLILLNFSSSSI